MAVVEVSITPLGTATPGVSAFIAGCLRLVKASGLHYQLNSMGTVIEGRKSEKQRGRIKSLRVRVDFIKAGDARIMLRGDQAGVGKRNKSAMVAGTVAFGLTGLLLTMGKKYQIPVGTPVTAYVDEDINLTPLE